MKDGTEKLAALIAMAKSSSSLFAEYRKLPGDSVPVAVEIVNGVPTYFVGDEEVTATQAVAALEAA